VLLNWLMEDGITNKNTIGLRCRGTAADAALSYADTFPDSVVDRSRAQN